MYLRITADDARTELSLQRECDPDRWDLDKGATQRQDGRNQIIQRVPWRSSIKDLRHLPISHVNRS